jgi:basic membrane lipoprotein Med (substrate-binding protein (PBP1-ABC) superfamily)
MLRLLLTVTTLALLACSNSATPPAFKVALVTPGSVADAAWNSGAYRGLLQLRDSLGAAISNIEARSPAEQEEALRSYASQGYTLVFGHGFEFQGIAERVAADFPNTIFVITSGERVSGKVAPMIFNIEEATYLGGMAAGGMTRSHIIGFVGGIQLPPIERGATGWTNGAKAVDPKVQSRVTYLNSFDDAAAGKEQALALIRAGADVLTHNADAAALGLFQAVKEDPKVYAVGANADQSALAPGQVLGSAVIDLPRAFLLVGKEVKEGTFTPRVESFGLASGVVRFDWDPTVMKRVPAPLQVRIRAAQDSIIAGTLLPLGPTH